MRSKSCSDGLADVPRVFGLDRNALIIPHPRHRWKESVDCLCKSSSARRPKQYISKATATKIGYARCGQENPVKVLLRSWRACRGRLASWEKHESSHLHGVVGQKISVVPLQILIMTAYIPKNVQITGYEGRMCPL